LAAIAMPDRPTIVKTASISTNKDLIVIFILSSFVSATALPCVDKIPLFLLIRQSLKKFHTAIGLTFPTKFSE
jgi:hypothetical protein